MGKKSAAPPAGFDVKGQFERASQAATDKLMESALKGMHGPLSQASLTAVDATINPGRRDPFGDGDQTPITRLKGNAGVAASQPLRLAWSTSLDVQQTVLCSSDFPAHTAAFTGDYRRLLACVQAAGMRGGERAVFELIEKRASLIRLNVLSYAVLGSRNVPTVGPKGVFPEEWKKCVELLINFGADVNAKDMAGYPVISIAAGVNATEQSLALIPLLANAGADPNIRTRFGEPILMHTIMTGETAPFKALLVAGGNLDIGDNDGLTPREMSNGHPIMRGAIAAAVREMALAETECSSCSKMGALMRCTICQISRYCDKQCQTVHWKKSHKRECSKRWGDASVSVDIDLKTMLATELAPGFPVPLFQSMLTGKAGGKMRPKVSDVGKIFVVKVQKPYSPDVGVVLSSESRSSQSNLGPDFVGALKVTRKNSEFFLVAKEGPGAAVHSLLTSLTAPVAGELVSGKRYYPARWLPAKKEGESPTVLRICFAKALPLPKSSW